MGFILPSPVLARKPSYFDAEFCQEVSKEHQNIILFPKLVYSTLSSLAIASKSKSQTQLLLALDAPSHTTLFEYYKTLPNYRTWAELDSEGSFPFHFFGAISSNYELNPKFQDFSQKYFPLSFIKGNYDSVTKWAKDKSHGEFNSLIPAYPLGSSVLVFNLGTLRFSPPPPVQSHRSPFQLTPVRSLETQFVKWKQNAKHFYNNKKDIVEFQHPQLPKDFNVILVLPKENVSLSEIETDLHKNWGDWLNEISEGLMFSSNKELFLSLPACKFQSQFSMVPSLKKMGIESIFVSPDAKLNLMSSYDLYINDYIYKGAYELANPPTQNSNQNSSQEGDGVFTPHHLIFNRPFLILIIGPSPHILVYVRVVNPHSES